MAIDMSRENTSLVVSPRISFSHDLCHTGGEAVETAVEDKRCCRRDSSLLDLGNNSDDFDFCISNNSGNNEVQTSSAEELFSNGLIRTVQEKKLVTTSGSSKPRHVVNRAFSSSSSSSSSSSCSLPPLPTSTTTNGISISKQESLLKESDHQLSDQHNKVQSKSFWRIKRSSSLHCDNKKISFWSLPLLSRSNSTGSVQSNHPPKQNGNSRQQRNNNNNNTNASGISASSSSSSSSTTTFYVYPLSQKPPLRRNYLGPNNGNGLRINPVLNVPSPHISKGTANLLGLGSFFRNGKEKKIKK